MRRLFCTFIAGLVVIPSARAQTYSGIPAVDSAFVARAAWGQAADAFSRGDLATARRNVQRAAAAWPTQEAYAWGRVVIALRAADTAEVIRSLNAYAATGFGRDLSADKRFTPFARVAGFAAAAARVNANNVPLAKSTPRATLPDSTFWPEGMDVDVKSGHVFVASARHGIIAELASDGQPLRTIVPRDGEKVGALLGVRYDTARGVLWATAAGLPQSEGFVPADTLIAALLRIRTDGTVERRWNLPPSSAGHALGDLAIAPNGDVFVSDSREPVLYRLRADADTLERFEHPLFHSLQGMAPTPDGRAIYVADWSHGILRLDLSTRRVTRLADAPNSSSLGCDGIALDGNTIIAVQNGSVPRRIMRFTIDAAGTRIVRAEVVDRNTAVADEPTIGAIVGREFVYVANSQWDKYDDNGARIPNTVLARPVLLALRLSK